MKKYVIGTMRDPFIIKHKISSECNRVDGWRWKFDKSERPLAAVSPVRDNIFAFFHLKSNHGTMEHVIAKTKRLFLSSATKMDFRSIEETYLNYLDI